MGLMYADNFVKKSLFGLRRKASVEDMAISLALMWNELPVQERLFALDALVSRNGEQPKVVLWFLLEALWKECTSKVKDGDEVYVWDDLNLRRGRKRYMPMVMPKREEFKVILQRCMEEVVEGEKGLVEEVESVMEDVAKRKDLARDFWAREYRRRLQVVVLFSRGKTGELRKMFWKEKDPHLRLYILTDLIRSRFEGRREFLLKVAREDRTKIPYYCDGEPGRELKVIVNGEVFACRAAAFIALREEKALSEDLRQKGIRSFIKVPKRKRYGKTIDVGIPRP